MSTEKLPYCSLDGDWSARNPKLCYSEGGRYLKLSFERSPAMEWNQEQFWKPAGHRGVCKGFSFGSRRRMLDRLNQVSKEAEQPDFVTLTLPDNCFEDCVSSFARTAKLHLDTLLKRVRRACPSACGFWRIEWKARLSGLHVGKLFPHFHLLVWGLPQRGSMSGIEDYTESFIPVVDRQLAFDSLCGQVLEVHVFAKQRKGTRFVARKLTNRYRVEDAERVQQRYGVEHTYMSFFDWVSQAWYHVVGSGNLDHFLAGCRVERIRTWGGVLSYCAKYMSKADAEGFLSQVPTGRSWGIFNRENMPWAKLIEIQLDDDTGNRIRRIARRYLEHRLERRVQRHYGLTLYCDTANFARMLGREPDTPF